MWLDDQLPSLLAELLKQIRKRQPHTSDHTVVGKVVRVADRIQPGRLGSVLIPVRGGTEEFYARSAATAVISAGQMVEVIAYAPPRTVDVEPVDALTLTKQPTPEL